MWRKETIWRRTVLIRAETERIRWDVEWIRNGKVRKRSKLSRQGKEKMGRAQKGSEGMRCEMEEQGDEHKLMAMQRKGRDKR